MKRPRSVRAMFIVAIVSGIATLAGGLELRGIPIRNVHILTLFAGGVACGVSLAQAIAAYRAQRAERSAARVG